MNYTIKKITHKPGYVSHIQSITKNDYIKFKKNNNVIGGSNGSYVTLSNSETNMYFLDDTGKQYCINVYYILKKVTNGRRFTKEFIKKINEKLVNKSFTVSRGEFIEMKLEDLLTKTIV